MTSVLVDYTCKFISLLILGKFFEKDNRCGVVAIGLVSLNYSKAWVYFVLGDEKRSDDW
jgi:hypothetical protein